MPKEPFIWKSMEEILPALLKSWMLLGKYGHKVKVIRLSRAECRRKIHIPKGTTDLVWLSTQEFDYGPLSEQLVKTSSHCQWWLHLHGDPQRAMMFGGTLRLTKNTIYIVASEEEKRALRITRPIAKCVVFPFPIASHAKVKAKPKLDENKILLTYVGRISQQKNVAALVRALEILRKKGLDAKLDVFGPFDTAGAVNFGEKKTRVKSELKALIARLELKDHVRFNGNVSRQRLKQIWNEPRIFVSASLHWDENFGAAAFRALESGCNAVLSSWGGHRQLQRIFKKRVQLVPVFATKQGLHIDPRDIAKSVVKSMRSKPKGQLSMPTPEWGAKLLNHAIRTLRPNNRAMAVSGLSIRLKARNVSKYYGGKQIFAGFFDPIARSFMIEYGAIPRGFSK